MPTDLGKRIFTVDEYYKMAASNIFENERVELVEGEVVTMAPKGSLHTACVARLNQILTRRADASLLVRVQDPIVLSKTTELEPDIAVVDSRPDYYASGHPTAKEALLIIEVAVSSLRYDRDTKVPLYARSGVPEVWLVDPTKNLAWVYSSPSAEGYESVQKKSAGEALESTTLPQLQLNVDDILG